MGEPGSAEERDRRGLRFRKPEDHAVTLFREARQSLGDVARVDRILLELGRFYNPLIDAPIVDLATRRRIVELLRAGRREEAAQSLDACLARYASAGEDAQHD